MPHRITLLDLIRALNGTDATEQEVVASVVDLLESGRVRLLNPPTALRRSCDP